MVNFVGKLVPNLTEKCSSIKALLYKSKQWIWEAYHEKKFGNLKQLLQKAPGLTFYDSKCQTNLSTDASEKDHGTALM